jgi:hypothetical protein
VHALTATALERTSPVRLDLARERVGTAAAVVRGRLEPFRRPGASRPRTPIPAAWVSATTVSAPARASAPTIVREREDDVVVLPAPTPTVDVDTLIRDAAVVMGREETSRIEVVEDGRSLGELTDRDLVLHALAEGLDPMGASVGDVLARLGAA